MARLRVPSGFLLVAAFAWFAHPSPQSLAFGLPVPCRAGAAGLGGGPPREEPTAHHRRTVCLCSQPSLSRHVSGRRRPGHRLPQPGFSLLFALVFLFIYLPVIMLEEQHLRELFPEFEQYARNVPSSHSVRKTIRPAVAVSLGSFTGKTRNTRRCLDLWLDWRG